MSIFEGPQSEANLFLAERREMFYVYLLARPDGRPFYVGEGKGDRVFQHVMEARRAHRAIESNPHKCNVIRSIERDAKEIIYRIDSLHADKPAARRREGELIIQLKRVFEGGPLTNLAGGHANPDFVAPFSRERHTASLSGEAEHPEKRRLNEFFASISRVGSTPIKPLSMFKRQIRRTTTQTKPGNLLRRSAGALVASASCNGLTIGPGVQIPRLFTFDGIQAVVENGVSENITGSGIVGLIPHDDPKEEKFVLTDAACALIRNLIGEANLEGLGVV